MLDVLEKCKDGDIVYDYFYGGKTIKEIASEKKLSGETIRIKIKKSLNKIKKSV
jgi:DNA-binding NarL/FixJ family response regulator